jgi:long-chain acyl-CoA synthetase
VGSRLANYKRLHAVVIVDSVPRLPSGKALRRELRARWLDGQLTPDV